LSNYLKQAIDVLPKQEFVINRLDLLFKDHPHLQPIQESIYKMVKTFLSAIKHPDCMQFRNVDFADRVSDADRVADACANIQYCIGPCNYIAVPSPGPKGIFLCHRTLSKSLIPVTIDIIVITT